MNYLVTGGTGFIGSHLVELLLKKGGKVRVPIRESSSLKWLPVNHPNLEPVRCNLFDKDQRRKLLENVEVVFHLAGLTKAPGWKDYRKINYEMVKLLYGSCVEMKTVNKFIFIGSQAAKGPSPSKTGLTELENCDPVSDYGKSKLLAVRYLKRQKAIPTLICYPPSVFGPRDKDIYVYFKLIDANIAPFIGHKTKYADIIYVKDLVLAIEMLSREDWNGTLEINISSGKLITWQFLSSEIAKALKKNPVKVYVPELILRTAGLLVEVICRLFQQSPLLNRQKIKEMLAPYWLLDSTRLRDRYGFKEKYGLRRGIRETGDWYLKQGWIKGE